MKTLIAFIFLLLFFLYSQQTFAQKLNISFEHYSIAEGLSEPITYAAIQDREGYLWFGTWSGIEKYDGYQFTAYKHDPDNPNSIDNAFVETLYEDKEGNIWVGTWLGLEKFDKKTGNFTHYKPDGIKPRNEWSNHVFSICEDSSGTLWIGTGDGLYKFDKTSESFTSFRHDENNPGSIANNYVIIYKDKAENLWFGTGKGLDKLDRSTGSFIHYYYGTGQEYWGSSKYWILSILEDENGIFWLGTNGGLVEFDRADSTFILYNHNSKNPLSIGGNIVKNIAKDMNGKLWLSTTGTGLSVFDTKTKTFTNYRHDDNNPRSLNSDWTFSVLCEKSGTVWVTSFDGLNKLNINQKPFVNYSPGNIVTVIKGQDSKLWIQTPNRLVKLNPETGKMVRKKLVNNFDELRMEDEEGNLWVAKQHGLYKLNITGHVEKYFLGNGKEFTSSVSLVKKTSDGRIWVGTFSDGLYVLNNFTKILTKVKIPAKDINQVYEDNFGLVWVGSRMHGLYSYDLKMDSVTPYLYARNDPTSLSGQTVLDIQEDKSGILWIGTNIGLNKFNRSTGKFKHFVEKDGLPSNAVFTILIDKQNNLWLDTRKGISKFNPKTEKFQNFDESDGLPKEGFIDAQGVELDNGWMYFAGNYNIIGFYPDSIKSNTFIPPIVITNFLKFDKPFPVQKKIELSYKDNFLSFEFAALNFISSEKNQYAYKMEGIDKDWVYSGTRRYASYPNLSPGEYIFRIKGSNNDGVWNEKGTSIAIFISPPWWLTWWAYSCYAFISVFSLYGIRRYELNRLRLKDKVKMDEAVLKERVETDIMKSRFFANISHEFRTPLTLILGPAEKISSKTSDDIIKDANIIKRNSRRLLQLINQLLELSKLEAGKLKLEASKGNIVSFVKGVALSFESLAESKDITLKLLSEKEFIELYFDKEKMMKIISNILSNAFKFTPGEGTITISVKELAKSTDRNKNDKPGSVQIKIKDTGIGILQDEIPKLFDRFYQVDSSFTREYEGTGIGLALTKELVELHYGTVIVESKKADVEKNKPGWTEFTLEFLLGRDHLKEEEIFEEKEINETVIMIEKNTLSVDTDNTIYKIDSSSKAPQNDNEMNEEKTIILIVEDNFDMRQYIRESLTGNYQFAEAVNGEQGVRKAQKIIPDLIISDMMMPKMDGNELVKILKNDEKTSHIPIILLTAKAGQENKLEGLEIGADDYLTKPFDIKELQARIKNLIIIRKKLQEKFSKAGYIPQPSWKKMPGMEEQFINKVLKVIEEHISEESFDIESFGEEVGMSRTQFYRKLKAITGMPASVYLRKVRLVKAKEMIEEHQGTISEIAYSVGFSSPSYFTKCFKDEFGYLPSEADISE